MTRLRRALASGLSLLSLLSPLSILASGAAQAQSYSFPSTTADAGAFYPSAYRDEGGQDWNCGSVYYSGHKGTDFAIGGWSSMAVGRDITAAADGTVTTAHDGEFDECTTGACGGGGGCGNYAIVQHADGMRTMYCHMKIWTVAVSSGQTVSCGQKLGEVGSSGNSTGPHLHFEPRSGSSSSTSVEPFAGPCGASSTRWNNQGAYRSIPDLTCGAVDADGDGYTATDDCNDADSAVHPGADEWCNGKDDNCDGSTDGRDAIDAHDVWIDADGDSYGDPAVPDRACTTPAGWVDNDDDCNDANDHSYPGAPELCDGEDNDCEGDIDEGYELDLDGYRTCDGDCEDLNEDIHPGALEVLDGIDNDCDGQVDEGTAAYDDDHDGWSEDQGDCDDQDGFTYPAAPEMADGEDDDCDALIDEGTRAVDDDGDGWSEDQGDCDDHDPAAHPTGDETSGGESGLPGDEDCDGVIDEGTAHWDDDGDGWSEDQGDCDDQSRLAFPGAPEQVDGEDNDCNGLADDSTRAFDDDGDGWSEDDGDCDDDRDIAYPLAEELPNDEDDDCDFIVDNRTVLFDDDHDGWTEEAGDCDDRSAAVWPDTTEAPNGQDDDCDGATDEGTLAYDDDGDGRSEWEHDCDDGRPEVGPGFPEQVDGQDNDCDGLIDDETPIWDDDADGLTEEEGDCDDGDPLTHPGAAEADGEGDRNCDGHVAGPEGWFAASCGTTPRAAAAGGGLWLVGLLLAAKRRRR